jgi:endo-beta-N-acetylglucosaminidase D
LHQITLVEIGKDAEYWGGYYGTVFSNERFFIHTKQTTSEKNILATFGNRGIAFDNVSTFFNLGFGNNYYLNGKQVSGDKWNNYGEYDASLLLSNLSSQVAFSKHGSDFTYQVTTDIPHYVGGSSLLIKGSFNQENDEVTIKLQDKVEIMKEEGIYDVKVAFKMDYRVFKKGEITLVLKYESDEESKEDITEEFCMFSPEIK